MKPPTSETMTSNKDQDQTFSAIDIPQTVPKKSKNNFFAKILHRQFGQARNGRPEDAASHYCETPTSQPVTPLPQKLFFKPGVIEEQDEMDFPSRAESPLMYRASNYIISPSMSGGLNRTSTCNSTLSQMAGRQDSSGVRESRRMILDMESPRSDKKLLIGDEMFTPVNGGGQISPEQMSPGVYFPNKRRLRPGFSPRVRKRAILKNGECNILQSRISKRRLRFLQDIFTTLVDTQWRWTLIVFAMSFLLSWLGFAIIWWLIAFTHGDFEDDHLPLFQADNSWTPCVTQLNSFTSCFLFSIETQHTIGYGSRATTEECPEAVFVMCLQSISGVMIQAFMVGIVFAKMTRPKHRTQTLLFSKNAVICQRDGLLCLMFRVGDMRKSHIIGASIRAQLIRQKTTKEGEILNQYQTELSVSADGCDGDLFFIWPMTIVHKIDSTSPLFHLSPRNFLNEQFEIVVILEGTIESTGQTTQARSSYIANEVLWGHRFEPVVSYSKDRRGYEVNYSKFDNVLEVDTPLCSGYELQTICMNPIETPIPTRAYDQLSTISAVSPMTKIKPIRSMENLLDGEDTEYESDRGIVLHRPNDFSSDSEDGGGKAKMDRRDSTYETHV